MITPSSAYQTEHEKNARTPIYQFRINLTHPLDSTVVANLKAYWKLDETAGIRYDAIGLAHLQDRNTVGSIAGKIGTAASFIGANSECLATSVSTNSPLRPGDNDFGISAWVQLSTLTGTQTILAHLAYAGGWALYYDGALSRFRFLIRSDAATTVAISADVLGAPSANTWYHIIAWHDASANTINICVNNGSVNSVATGGINPPSQHVADVCIGAVHSANSATTAPIYQNFLSGRIDEVSFWRKPFSTAGDRTQLYNAGAGYAIPFTDPFTKNICTSHPSSGEDIGLELLDPIELDRRAEIENCRLPLSTFTCELTDVDEDISALMATGIAGARCELRASFYDIAWSEAVLLFTGLVGEIEHYSGKYRVTSRSVLAAAQDKALFDASKTRLTGAISSTDTTIPVADTTAFAPLPGDLLWGATTGNIVIDNEFMFPAGKTSTSFTPVTRVGATLFAVPPQVPNSQATTHSVNAVVREMISLGRLSATNSDAGTNDLHPIDLLNVILSRTAKFGMGELGIQPNAAELAAARAELGTGLRMRFLMDEVENAKKFIEEEIYLPCAMYPTENNRGELGAKLFPVAPPGGFDTAIHDAHITEFPEWLHNAEKRINMVIYYFDYNPITREYTSSFEYRDETLIGLHGRELPLVIYSKGLRSYYSQTVPVALNWFSDTAAFLQSASQRHISRFGNTSPVIGVRTIFAKSLMELSDDVEATFAQAINIDTGTRQITNAAMEISAIRHDFQRGLVDMQLLSY